MAETNSASQLTSNYVLSPTNRLEVVTAPRRFRASRFRPTYTSSSISSTIVSGYTEFDSQELCDAPSNPSHQWHNSNLSSSTNPADIQDSVDHNVNRHSENRPIFKVNALFVQALLYPITVLIYLLFGAAMFTAIEHDHEQMTRTVSQINAMQTIAELKQTVEALLKNLNISENTSEEIINNFTSNFTNLCEDYSTRTHIPPYNRWEFLPSFYFAATVITTIGEVIVKETHAHHLHVYLFFRLWTCITAYKFGASISLCIRPDGNTTVNCLPDSNW